MLDHNLQKADIIKELEIGTLPESVQNEIISQLGENILLSITSAVLLQLSDEDKDKFGAIVETRDEEQIRAFLLPRIPHLDELVTEKAKAEIADLKNYSQK